MADPTIFEILSSLQNVYLLAEQQIRDGSEINNILQQEWYKEKEGELKRDIARARLKSKRLSYFVMTINMNGASLGPGTASNRRLLLTIILRNFPCSLILSQEQNPTFLKNMPGHLEARENGMEAAVIWDKNDFEGTDEGLQSSNPRIIKIRDEVERQFNEFGLMSQLLLRIKMVKLTSHSENHSFLAVSWHGPFTGVSVKERRNLFRGLQKFVKKVSEKEGNIPFLIGGDFNFDTLDNAPVMDGVIMPSYSPSPRAERRQNYIPHKDNFVFSRYGIHVKWVRPLDFTSRSEQTQAASDLSEEEQRGVENIPVKQSRGVVDDLLDHDPVIGVFKLQLPLDPVVQKLAEEFQVL